MLKNKVHNQDYLKALTKLENNSIDLVIADPPYNIGKNFGNNSDKQSLDNYLEFSFNWISKTLPLLKDTSTFYIYGRNEILSLVLADIRKTLEKNNFDYRFLVWSYTNKTVPSYNFWQRSYESILIIYKNDKIFNRDLVRIEYTESYKKLKDKPRKNTKGRFGNKETVYQVNKLGALPRDVINIPALAGGAGKNQIWGIDKDTLKVYSPSELSKLNNKDNIIKHPTEKPYQLTETLIKASVDFDKTNKVLIPFSGSGSELVVLKKYNLDFFAFELNNIYCHLANQRYKNFNL